MRRRIRFSYILIIAGVLGVAVLIKRGVFRHERAERLKDEMTQADASGRFAQIGDARDVALDSDAGAAKRQLDLLDQIASKRKRTNEEAYDAAIQALASMQPRAFRSVLDNVILEERSPLAEKAVMTACRSFGPPAAPWITERLTTWKIFPDSQELIAWIRLLGDLGDPSAVPALNWALGQGVPGIERQVEEARRSIESTSGTKLADPRPPLVSLAAAPGDEAFMPLITRPFNILPATHRWNGVPDNGVVRIELPAAFSRRKGAGFETADVRIELVRRDGRWESECWGYAINWNKRLHPGTVREVEEDTNGKHRRLEIEMAVLNDPWVAGGFAEYRVDLPAGADAASSTFEGAFNTLKVGGKAVVTSWAHDWIEPNVPVPEPGEHPRLLFRRADIPTLRARLRTAFGRRVLEGIRGNLSGGMRTEYRRRVNWVTTWEPGMQSCVGHGFLADLFGDTRHGRRAAALMLERTRVNPYLGEHGERWPRPMSLWGFGHDLAYNSLTEKERRKTVDKAAQYNNIFSPRNGLLGTMAGGRPAGMWGPPGTSALSIVNEKGRFHFARPKKPPTVLRTGAQTPDPKGKPVPVNLFLPGQMMADWLFIGPVPFNKGDEPFKELGGIAQLRLHEGQIVETDGKSYRAETLPTNAVVELKLERVAARYVRIPNQLPDHRCYFFSLVTFGHRLACRPVIPFRATTGEARLWIDGEPVGPDGVIVFEPGLHRVLIETPGARIWPKFEPIDLEYLEGSLRRYPVLKEHWEHLRAQQKTTGLMSTPRYAAEMCRRGMRTWLDYRIDRAGRADVQWPFVHACRVVLGQPLSPDTPFPWADGIRAEDLKELTGLTLCFAMGLAPDHVKDTFAKEFERRYQQEGWEKLGCLELIAALVNYPLTPERDEGWHLIEQARQEKAVE